MSGNDEYDPTVSNSSRQVAPARRTLGPGYIRVGAAIHIPATLRQFGIDPDQLIHEAGLDPQSFQDIDGIISHAGLGKLLTLCVARTRCAHFGLLVGRQATILSYGLIGRLMQHSATLGDALRSLAANLHIQNRGAVPYLHVAGDTAIFSYAVNQPQSKGSDQISDAALACAVVAIRALRGSSWSPTETLLARSVPADQEPYRRHFRAPISFNRETGALVFPVSDLGAPVPGADPFLKALLEERLTRMKTSAHADFSDDVRRIVRVQLSSSHCTAGGIAQTFDMNRRTLLRHLNHEGVSFRVLNNEIRFEVACQLLADTDMSLIEIATTLGYSEASAFTRAFRRWADRTPSSWRATHQQSGAL
ncbi:MAG: AraC family transcriptional regulator [Xanthobacteraceae bacterium]|jgi:AraC-like DNA-binding protein|nr:AraC family transcriptional regulator [Xanthobacteraceae bacterium]